MDDESVAGATRALREQELLRRIHELGDLQARDQLAEEMLPLARALAGRYAGRGEPLDDLVQVACVGIMKAIDGFDITREVRFSSYATPTVLGEIKRHFRDKTWSVRVPRGLQELQLQVAKERDRAHERARPLADRPGARRRDRRAVRGGARDDPESRARGGTRSLEEPTGEDVDARRLARRQRPRARPRGDARARSTARSASSAPATARSCGCASRTT